MEKNTRNQNTGGEKLNTDHMPQKPRMLYKAINIILLFMNSSFAFGICSTYSFETLQIPQKAIPIVPAVLLTSSICARCLAQHLLKPFVLRRSVHCPHPGSG